MEKDATTGETPMNYWPGTKIVKSQNNAFTEWKTTPSKITATKKWKQSERATQTMAGTGGDPMKQFTVYSKARKSK